MQLPLHLSHSSRESLERCARSYFLSRLAKAPQRPALWLAGGSAVHEVTEFYDLTAVAEGPEFAWEPDEVQAAWTSTFDLHLDKAREAEPNENAWKRSESEPIEVWNRLGPEFVQSYMAWRKRSPWEIWTTPDDRPAIELDVSGNLPGCDVEIKAYLDRVFWDPVFKQLVILDLKTGRRPPKNADQFGTYAALLKVKYDVDAVMGVPFMNRKATLGKPHDLAEYTPEHVGEIYGKAWEQIQEYVRTGHWPADTSDCFLCDVSASCAAVNGPLAHLYDPASPGYRPPF
ncbi:PD-(D/E)XK nuclease family protein [Streptomyces nodosus]|uniref:RecB family exonuclease n=1 Tax=Streptomyces nodosus TaxID=40318 RepID=UPI003451B43A